MPRLPRPNPEGEAAAAAARARAARAAEAAAAAGKRRRPYTPRPSKTLSPELQQALKDLRRHTLSELLEWVDGDSLYDGEIKVGGDMPFNLLQIAHAIADAVAETGSSGRSGVLWRGAGNPIRVLDSATKNGSVRGALLVDMVAEYHHFRQVLHSNVKKILEQSGLPWHDAEFREAVRSNIYSRSIPDSDVKQGVVLVKDIFKMFIPALRRLDAEFKPRPNYFPQPHHFPRLVRMAQKAGAEDPIATARAWLAEPDTAPPEAQRIVRGARTYVMQESALLDELKTTEGFLKHRKWNFELLDPIEALERYVNWFSEYKWGRHASDTMKIAGDLAAPHNIEFTNYLTAMRRAIWGEEGKRVLVGGSPSPFLEYSTRALSFLSSASSLAFNLSSTIMQLAGLISAIPVVGLGNVLMGMAEVSASIPTGFSVIKDAYKRSKALNLRYRRAPHIKQIVEPLRKKVGAAAGRVMFANLALFDAPVAVAIWRGGLRLARQKGLTGKAAEAFADKMLLLATSASKPGLRALIHENQVGEWFMQFALEANNLWQALTGKGDVENTPVEKTFKIAATIAALYLTNEGLEQLLGRRPLPDPINAVIEAQEDIEEEKYAQAAGELLNEILTSIRPIGAIADYLIPPALRRKVFEDEEFGIFGGKAPIASYAENVIKAIIPPSDGVYTQTERWLGLLPGGVQLRRMALAHRMETQGQLEMQRGVIPVMDETDVIKVSLFGASAFEGIRAYYDGKPYRTDIQPEEPSTDIGGEQPMVEPPVMPSGGSTNPFATPQIDTGGSQPSPLNPPDPTRFLK